MRMLILIMYARLFAMSAMNMILGILRGEAVFCALIATKKELLWRPCPNRKKSWLIDWG